MILVFSPVYFRSLDCAREYFGMEQLEKHRFSNLPEAKRGFGLIIPVVVRGGDYLPEKVVESKMILNFDKFLVGDAAVYRSHGFRRNVRKIAETSLNDTRYCQR
jgi:hypothetical protein